MRRSTRLAILSAFLFWTSPAPFAAAQIDEALYASLLERHTRAVDDTAGTRVDYAALADSEAWRRLVRGLSAADPTALGSRAERLAFWINAYNILAIDLVVKGRPETSIKDLGSFFSPVWKKPAGKIAGRTVTLDEIEHRILRPMGEPRIHAAIVCASTSCPSLRREPWTADRLEAHFDDTLRGFLASPEKGFRIDRARETVHLSKIFDWFAEDFEEQGGVLVFLRPYLSARDAAWLEAHPRATVRYLDYDWTLNRTLDT